MHCSRCQMELYILLLSIWAPWLVCGQATKQQHWGGVGQRAGVCVFGNYPLHNPRKQTDSICRGLCLDEIIMHEAELQPRRTSTNTHIYIHTGAWAHKQSHTHMSFYGNSKQTLMCMWWPHPGRKEGETETRERQKQTWKRDRTRERRWRQQWGTWNGILQWHMLHFMHTLCLIHSRDI